VVYRSWQAYRWQATACFAALNNRHKLEHGLLTLDEDAQEHQCALATLNADLALGIREINDAAGVATITKSLVIPQGHQSKVV
jgi:hypothetical protein